MAAGGEQLDPGGGQLDGQRQPVQADADLGHGRGLASVSGKSGCTARRARQTAPPPAYRDSSSSAAAAAGRAAPAAAPANSCSPRRRSVARLVTSTLRAGQAASRSATCGRGVEHLLEVVEDQQQLLVAQLDLQVSSSARPPRSSRMPSARAISEVTSARIADRGQVDQHGAVAHVRRHLGGGLQRQARLAGPAGPVRVSRRTSGRASARAPGGTSCSRPISGVGWAGMPWLRQAQYGRRRARQSTPAPGWLSTLRSACGRAATRAAKWVFRASPRHGRIVAASDDAFGFQCRAFWRRSGRADRRRSRALCSPSVGPGKRTPPGVREKRGRHRGIGTAPIVGSVGRDDVLAGR